MKLPRFLLLCMALLSALWLGAAHALPTVDEVQAAARRGDYAGAEKMMREVVAARPDSARAHYVLAEILAHQRQFHEAVEHASRARALDPSIKFTDPARFTSFEQALQREQAAPGTAVVPAAANPPQRSAPVERGGGVPVWMLAGGALVFIWLVTSWMRRRAAQQAQPGMTSYGPAAGGAPGGHAGGYGGMPQQPMSGAGRGMLGVGLGAAGGFAAGMLAEKMLHGGHDTGNAARDASGGLAGGLIPGSFDGGGSAADELASRDIDFGSGDGWGGGDLGGGGDDW